MVKFATFSPDESLLVTKILSRAQNMAQHVQIAFDHESFYMDLSATHATIPLDLDKLLHMDDFNFAHDVYGIIQHLNRRTGLLQHGFLPRCTLPASFIESPFPPS